MQSTIADDAVATPSLRLVLVSGCIFFSICFIEVKIIYLKYYIKNHEQVVNLSLLRNHFTDFGWYSIYTAAIVITN